MILALVLCAAGVVVGTGSRASTLMVSPVGKPSLGKSVEQVVLTDVISPSIMQRGSVGSAQFMLDLALGESVSVEPRPPDDAVKDEEATAYGRVKLGKVWLHEKLLEAGWAWVSPPRKDAALLKLEAAAREAKRGLWAEAAPLEPWKWHELTMLGDQELHVVHSGWECPHVAATQCSKCRGGRYYSLAEAKAAGLEPHEQCMTGETLRIAEASGAEEPVTLKSARRACAKDDECALTAATPCTCPPCGPVSRQAARREIAERMKVNFAKVACGGVGCPACATMWTGTKAVCVDGQCAAQ